MTENNAIAADQLRALIERIERMEAEKKDIAEDIKQIYLQAKGKGYDVKIMRQIIRERAMEPDKRQEQEYLLATYRKALGMLADTPLGEAAIARQAS